MAAGSQFHITNIHQLGIVETTAERQRIVRNSGKVLQKLPLLRDDVQAPVRRVDHSEEHGKSGFLDIVCMLDAVNIVRPIDTEPPHLIRLHNQIIGVKPFIANMGEEQSSLAKLERLVLLVNVTDTANKQGFCEVKFAESIYHRLVRSVRQRTQGVLNRYIPFASPTLGGQIEVVAEKGEDFVRVLDPGQGLVPFVCITTRNRA